MNKRQERITDNADYINIYLFRKSAYHASAYGVAFLSVLVISVAFEFSRDVCGKKNAAPNTIVTFLTIIYILFELLRIVCINLAVKRFDLLTLLISIIVSIIPTFPLLVLSVVFLNANLAALVLGIIQIIVFFAQFVLQCILFSRLLRIMV